MIDLPELEEETPSTPNPANILEPPVSHLTMVNADIFHCFKKESEALLQPNKTLVQPYWAACIFLLDLQLNVSFVSYLWVHSLGLISSLPPSLISSNPVFYCLWKAFILCCPLVLSYQPHCQCCRLSAALHTMVYPLPSKHTSIFSKRGSQWRDTLEKAAACCWPINKMTGSVWGV